VRLVHVRVGFGWVGSGRVGTGQEISNYKSMDLIGSSWSRSGRVKRLVVTSRVMFHL
jgi:hypothetical protein